MPDQPLTAAEDLKERCPRCNGWMTPDYEPELGDYLRCECGHVLDNNRDGDDVDPEPDDDSED